MPNYDIPAGAIIVETKPNTKIPGALYASHLAIYTGANVIHAYPNLGVTRAELMKYDDDEPGNTNLVEVSNQDAFRVVIHKNPEVLKAISEMANKAHMNYTTRFEYNTSRYKDLADRSLPPGDKAQKKTFSQDEQRHRELIALFRGVRNAVRIMSGRAISMKKGVSCDNFVSYVIQAAIIKTLFPQGVPESVINQVFAIEAIRTGEKNKKLDQVPVEQLEKFEKVFLQAMASQGQNLGPNHDEIVQELYRPVKHEIVFPYMSEHSGSWAVCPLAVQSGSPSYVSDTPLAVSSSKKFDL